MLGQLLAWINDPGLCAGSLYRHRGSRLLSGAASQESGRLLRNEPNPCRPPRIVPRIYGGTADRPISRPGFASAVLAGAAYRRRRSCRAGVRSPFARTEIEVLTSRLTVGGAGGICMQIGVVQSSWIFHTTSNLIVRFVSATGYIPISNKFS